MKALTIKQPWLYLIASGQKTIETRTWRTAYRGELLLASSKTFDAGYRSCIPNGLALVWKNEARIFGQALCIVTLVDCRPMTEADEMAACCRIYPGAYSWVLENVRCIEPFPVRGLPGLFEIPNSLVEAEGK